MGYALAVGGKTITEELFVEDIRLWLDFVFEEKYPLMQLSDLAKYINANGHLPENPSAGQVEN